MKIFWIGGNHSRHLYFINQIARHHDIVGGIVEMRENFLPTPPTNISIKEQNLFNKHFENRALAEKKFFGDQPLPKFNLLQVDHENLNSDSTSKFLSSNNPDLVIVFGSGMIRGSLFENLPKNSYNLHLGLSPRYRGSATLFWPFYFLEPQYCGATFHRIVYEPDAGNIVHQSVPVLNYGDKIHDVACKTVISATDDCIKLIDILKNKQQLIEYNQKGTGKNFQTNDFRPYHLKVNYELFNDDIVDKYLSGDLKKGKPKLVKQF